MMFRVAGPHRAAWIANGRHLVAALLLSLCWALSAQAQGAGEIRSFVAFFSGDPATSSAVETCSVPLDAKPWPDGTYRMILRDRAGVSPETVIIGVKIKDGKPVTIRDYNVKDPVEMAAGIDPAKQKEIFDRYPTLAPFLTDGPDAALALLGRVCAGGNTRSGPFNWLRLNSVLGTNLTNAEGLKQAAADFEIDPAPASPDELHRAMTAIHNRQTPVPAFSILGIPSKKLADDEWLRRIFLSFPNQGPATKQTTKTEQSGTRPEMSAAAAQENPPPGGSGTEGVQNTLTSNDPSNKLGSPEKNNETTPPEVNSANHMVAIGLGLVACLVAVTLLYILYMYLFPPRSRVAPQEVAGGKASVSLPPPSAAAAPVASVSPTDLTALLRELALKQDAIQNGMSEWTKYFSTKLAQSDSTHQKVMEDIEAIQVRLINVEQSLERLRLSTNRPEPPMPVPARAPTVPEETPFQANKAAFLAILEDMQSEREIILALNVTSDMPGLYQWLASYLLAPGQSRARYRDIADRMRARAMSLEVILPNLGDQLDERYHEPVGYHARAGRAQEIVELVQPGLIDTPTNQVIFKARVHISN